MRLQRGLRLAARGRDQGDELGAIDSAEIHVVFGHNDPSAYGAVPSPHSRRSEGREEQIKFIGIDGLAHEGINYVRQGSLDVTFYYPRWP